ncbi:MULTISPECIES: hypothetical protein [Clostridium]|uniref:hypothetical protein n=1 Tax=Clostridium TaxID=1485 RepID=UPI0006C0D153|nr:MULTISPECIES: hypothetical protein [Clostridium]CUP09508.1 Uncharacterised protein [Clostridium disporicum]
MDKELKKEIIIKGINKIDDEKFLNFLFGFVIGYNRTKIKENKKIDEIIIKLLDIQNRFN